MYITIAIADCCLLDDSIGKSSISESLGYYIQGIGDTV